MKGYMAPPEDDQEAILAAWDALPPGNYKARQVTAKFTPQAVGITLSLNGVKHKEGRNSKTWIKPMPVRGKEKVVFG